MTSRIDIDPEIEPLPVVYFVADGLYPLWRDALERPDNDIHRDVALDIIKAHALGLQGLDKFAPRLCEIAADPRETRTSRLAAVRALTLINDASAAKALRSALTIDGPEVAELIEPALAGWRDEAMQAEWSRRLSEPKASPRGLTLAIRGLDACGNYSTTDAVRRLALDKSQSAAVRMAAAQSLGNAGDKRIPADVDRLLRSTGAAPNLVDRIVGAWMLARCSGNDTGAVALLEQLSVDPAGSVAAVAVERLIELAPERLAPHFPALAAHADPPVRRLSAEAITAVPTESNVAILSKLLGDADPHVRGAAANAMVALYGDHQVNAAVVDEIAETLRGELPLSLEQAALVAGAAGISRVAGQLIEILDHPSSRVNVAAAWALAQIADPTTAAPILEKVQCDMRWTEAAAEQIVASRSGESAATSPPYDDALEVVYNRMASLLEALGAIGSADASATLAEFVPKPPWPAGGDPAPVQATKQPRLRAAALWSLGKIHASSPAPQALVAAIHERLADDTPLPAEPVVVRQMAAVSLARMNEATALPTLRQFYARDASSDELGSACGWAIERLTGEKPARDQARRRPAIDWRLAPLD